MRWAAGRSLGAHSGAPGAGRKEGRRAKKSILIRHRICGQERLAKVRAHLSLASCRGEARGALLFSPGRQTGPIRGSGPFCPGLWWLHSLMILGHQRVGTGGALRARVVCELPGQSGGAVWKIPTFLGFSVWREACFSAVWMLSTLTASLVTEVRLDWRC